MIRHSVRSVLGTDELLVKYGNGEGRKQQEGLLSTRETSILEEQCVVRCHLSPYYRR
jgi:hypothetical protein